MRKKFIFISAFLAFFCATFSVAQNVDVDVNLNIEHSVDGVSDFGRERHMTIHSTLTEPDWDGQEDMMDYLINDLDVYFGRDNGSTTWQLQTTPENPAKQFWPDTDAMVELGNGFKVRYEQDILKKRHQYEGKGDMIMGMNYYPVWPTCSWDPIGKTATGWQPYDVDATANWLAHYLDKYFSKTGDDIGQPLPKYWEGINEPDMSIFGAAGMYVTSPEKIWEFHNLMAAETKALLGNKAPKIGGMTWGQHDFALRDWTWRQDPNFYYDNASPEMEVRYRNMGESEVFSHRTEDWFTWDGMWQGFIDVAGENMDFYSVHIYDWPKLATDGTLSTDAIRTGGHVEAMLDLLEWYDMFKFGKKKDIVISEFGSVSGLSHEYPLYRRDWEQLRPFNQMMMQFLERPSHVVLTMPFAPVKAWWGDEWDANGNISKRYISTLMDPVGTYTAPGSAHEEWTWSGNILFFELWSDVKGTRIDTKASINDVQVDAYVDGKHVYLILNNLLLAPQDIDIHLYDDHTNPIKSVKVKHLYLNEGLSTHGLPVIDEALLGSCPGSVLLENSATMILDYTFENAVTIDQTSKETKFASVPLTTGKNMIGGQLCHVAVGGRSTLTTNVNAVAVPTTGEAVVRIGGYYWDITPESVTVNGHELITTPIDMRGRTKTSGRTFGVWEIPVPIEYLQEDNIVTCRADGNNNEYSSVMMQVWDFSKAPGRSANNSDIAVTGISLEPSASVMENNSLALGVDFTPVNATNKGITWSSSNPSVATVSKYGIVTAVASSGTTTITAKSTDNINATSNSIITAIPFKETAVTGLDITNGTNVDVEYFITTPLTATISPVDATIQDVVWRSSNADAVYVDPSTGKVTGLMLNETATITAKVTDTKFGNTVFEKSIDVYVTIEGDESIYTREIPEQLRTTSKISLNIPVKVTGQRNIEIELSKGGTVYGTGTGNVDYFGEKTVAVDLNLTTTPTHETGYTLTAKLFNGATLLDVSTSEVEMIDVIRVQSVEIVPGIEAVRIGETIPLVEEVFPANAYDKEVTWSSDKPAIASVDEVTGVVTGVGEGDAVITVTTKDGALTAKRTITSQKDTVEVPVTGISLPAEILIFPGGSHSPEVGFTPEWTTQTDINWSSDDTDIATVDQNGEITAGGDEGTVVITATSASDNSVMGKCTVLVSNILTIEAEDFVKTGGAYEGFDTYTIASTGVSGINYNQVGDWGEYEVVFPAAGEYDLAYFIGCPPENTDAGVGIYIDGVLQSNTVVPAGTGWDVFVEINNSGKITIPSAGKHTVRIISTGTSNWQWNCDRMELTFAGVVDVTAVTLEQKTQSVGISQEIQLYASVLPVNATNKNIKWSSSDDNTVTVSTDGKITGVAIGNAKVTATSEDGNFYKECEVTVQTDFVTTPVTGIKLNSTTKEILVGNYFNLNATISPMNASDKTVIWSSADESIATVNGGVVTGIADGIVVITAKSNDDNSILATCTVTVKLLNSIEELESEISMFPNPASTSISISGLSSDDYNVSIFNIQGIKYLDVNITKETAQSISVSELPNGFYIVNVSQASSNKTFRLIKVGE